MRSFFKKICLFAAVLTVLSSCITKAEDSASQVIDNITEKNEEIVLVSEDETCIALEKFKIYD